MNSTEEYQYIGKSEYNVNATAKATGRAKYCSDMQLTGMLHAKVKRSKVLLKQWVPENMMMEK